MSPTPPSSSPPPLPPSSPPAPRSLSSCSSPKPAPAASSTSALGATRRIASFARHLGGPSQAMAPAITSPSAPKSALAPATWPDHPTLLIPGPVEFDEAVLHAMSYPSESHVGRAFVDIFGDTISMLRRLVQTSDPDAQPFILSGSGTLGWDLVAANLVEPAGRVLVLDSGQFSRRFADCLTAYGADVTILPGPALARRPDTASVHAALADAVAVGRPYAALVVTHVDTSTGVLSHLPPLADALARASPATLFVVDAVCSLGCEPIAFDTLRIDALVSAPQKAVGSPAGLCLSCFSARALRTLGSRSAPVAAYFASLQHWLPIMKAYEAKKPAYFATPSPQLVRALHVSLTQILSRPLSDRFAQHRAVSDRVKDAVAALGLHQVAPDPDDRAHGMTAVFLPDGVSGPDLLAALNRRGVVMAGGLHREIATKYFRIGHMGVSVTDPARGHIDKLIDAIAGALTECVRVSRQG